MTDQQREEEAMFKHTFNFYLTGKNGVPLERYELPMILDACGYRLDDDVLARMNEFIDTKNFAKVDVNMLISAIKWYKDQQLTNDNEGDVDEYLDAFVALGGEADKEGYISKDVLVEIIKEEFELTIDMVDYLKGIGGDTDEINYYQFCVLLDAGTGGNPSRVSSYLS